MKKEPPKDRRIRILLIIIVLGIFFIFGIFPMLKNSPLLKNPSNEWAKNKIKHEDGKYDVVVVGEELDGIAAAISASKSGAKTLLIALGKDLGGETCKTLYTCLEANKGKNNDILNGGLFKKFYFGLGESFSTKDYLEKINTWTKQEKNLEIIYNSKIDSTKNENGKITGIYINVDSGKKLIEGKRFIDATLNGEILSLCKVPFTRGAEDLKIKNRYMPISLNFKLQGVKYDEIFALYSENSLNDFLNELKKYTPFHPNMYIDNFRVFDENEGNVTICGLKIFDVDISDEKQIEDTYLKAVEESKYLTSFLKKRFKIFSDAHYLKPAEKFYIPENFHYKGNYVLNVNDILENRDFVQKVSIGSKPVETGKISSSYSSFIIGKPIKYSIPLDCTIPLGIDNLLMTGRKISFTSLASSSSGNSGITIDSGEAAGVFAVYSIVKNMSTEEISNRKDENDIEEILRILNAQGASLSEIKELNPNASRWSYSEIKLLNNLGIIAGGLKNDYKFDSKATTKDLANILINGAYRISDKKQKFEIDTRLNKYLTDEPLDKDLAMDIIADFHGVKVEGADKYKKICDLGYISKIQQVELENMNSLTLEHVYYMGAYNLKLFAN